MLKSLVHTVATPRKNTGRDAPSSSVDIGVRVMNVPFPGRELSGGVVGYIVFVDGAKMAVMRPGALVVDSSVLRVLRRERSFSQVLGYEDRSSLRPN